MTFERFVRRPKTFWSQYCFFFFEASLKSSVKSLLPLRDMAPTYKRKGIKMLLTRYRCPISELYYPRHRLPCAMKRMERIEWLV